MNHDGVTAATMLLLAAFAVDRVSCAVTFLISRPRKAPVKPDLERAAWGKKFWYFAVASILTIVILVATNKVRLLQAMGVVYDGNSSLDWLVDLALTFIVLVGGAERISALLQSSAPASKPEPLEVRGTITLGDPEQSARPHATGQ